MLKSYIGHNSPIWVYRSPVVNTHLLSYDPDDLDFDLDLQDGRELFWLITPLIEAKLGNLWPRVGYIIISKVKDKVTWVIYPSIDSRVIVDGTFYRGGGKFSSDSQYLSNKKIMAKYRFQQVITWSRVLSVAVLLLVIFWSNTAVPVSIFKTCTTLIVASWF